AGRARRIADNQHHSPVEVSVMLETLVERSPALLIPLLAIGGTTLIFVVWIVGHYWCKSKRMEIESALKKDMLARQFTPADVERVLLAAAANPPERPSSGKETISDNEYYLVEKMLEEEYPAEEIERVVRAFKAGEKVSVPDERVMA